MAQSQIVLLTKLMNSTDTTMHKRHETFSLYLLNINHTEKCFK